MLFYRANIINHGSIEYNAYYRVGREEKFRIPEFEKMLLTPMGVIAQLLGKFGWMVYKYI